MKKHGLLKILGILLLLLVIVSYILPGRQGTIAYTGLADIFINFFGIVLQNFCYIVIFVLTIFKDELPPCFVPIHATSSPLITSYSKILSIWYL